MDCDFSIKVGKNEVTINYYNDKVCWEGDNQHFCYNGDTILQFRDFLNRSSGNVTNIVDEFQTEFAIRRQRAFWIVESMLSPKWCVLELTINPGCVFGEGEYTDAPFEKHKCFEVFIDTKDVKKYFINRMNDTKIRLTAEDCYEKGKKHYAPLLVRRVRLELTDCDTIETDYEAWINDVLDEAANLLYGGD